MKYKRQESRLGKSGIHIRYCQYISKGVTAVRHRHRSEDTMIIVLRKAVCENADWIQLAQDRTQWQRSDGTVESI
jgi:hypothetical protein